MSQAQARPEVAFVVRSHEALFEMVGRLCVALHQHRGAGHLANLRDDFLAALTSHMEFENYVMAANSYPLIYAHVEDHGAFKATIVGILDQALERGSAEGVAAAFRNAHDRHVAYHDDLLCRYLVDRYHLETVVDGLGI